MTFIHYSVKERHLSMLKMKKIGLNTIPTIKAIYLSYELKLF